MAALILTQPIQGTTFLTAYNAWRKQKNLGPVQAHTLRRYLAGGKGYEAGPPKMLVQFLRTLV